MRILFDITCVTIFLWCCGNGAYNEIAYFVSWRDEPSVGGIDDAFFSFG